MTNYSLLRKEAKVDHEPRRLTSTPVLGAALADYLLSFEGSGWDGDLDGLRSDSVTGLKHTRV